MSEPWNSHQHTSRLCTPDHCYCPKGNEVKTPAWMREADMSHHVSLAVIGLDMMQTQLAMLSGDRKTLQAMKKKYSKKELARTRKLLKEEK